MNNIKVNVAARLSILEAKTGHKITLDDISLDLTREQYERLQASYNTLKPKYMNDDESIADICNSFIDYYGYEDLEDDQKLVVSYPIEISTGLSFDSLAKNTDENINFDTTASFSEVKKSNWLPTDVNSPSSNRSDLALCNGIVASFSEDKNVFICFIPWLGRKIEIWLSSGDYDDASELNNLKLSFEKFWNEKESLLSASQNDIKTRLIPYINHKRETDKKSLYREVSEDDFDADYWLTSVYICSGYEDEPGEIQMNFYKDGNEDCYECFFVSRDLSSDFLTFYFDFDMITDDI